MDGARFTAAGIEEGLFLIRRDPCGALPVDADPAEVLEGFLPGLLRFLLTSEDAQDLGSPAAAQTHTRWAWRRL